MKIHPLCELFPEIVGAEWDSFRDSIAERGLDNPIVTYRDQIIDGRNRHRACVELGMRPDFVEWRPSGKATDDAAIQAEIAAFVVAANVERRHLTASQRSMVVAEIIRRGGDVFANLQTKTRAVLAEKLNVSERTVSDASKVLDNGAPEIVAAVKAGDVSVSDAAKVSDKPKRKQRAALKKVESGEAKTLREAGEDETAPEHDEGIVDELGKAVPKSLREVFSRSHEFGGIILAIGKLRTRIEALQQTDSGAALPAEKIAKLIDELQRAVKFGEPYTECATCKRKPVDTCKVCLGSGWVTKPTHERTITKDGESWLEARK